MKITKHDHREAKLLFRNCFAQGALDEERLRRTVRAILDEKPRRYLQIATELARLARLDLARRTARIESAAPLSEDLRRGIQENLARAYGANLRVTFTQNSALIGGLRIQVGSDVYDGSIQSRFQQIESGFAAAY